MKKVLMIIMLIIVMGLVGCMYNRGHDSDRGRYEQDRGRHDHDRDHDYEHQNRDNRDHEIHR